MFGRILKGALTLIGVLLFIGFSDLGIYNWADTPVGKTGCTSETIPSRMPSVPPAAKAALRLRDNERTTLAFGRSRKARTLHMRLDVTLPSQSILKANERATLLAKVEDFVRDDDEQLDLDTKAEHIPPTAVASGIFDGNSVRLNVCIDRRHYIGDPGTYHGTVTVNDSRVVILTLPVTLTLSYPYPNVVALLLPVIGVIAAIITWSIREKRQETAGPLNSRFFRWVGTIAGISALAAGTAAMITAFYATYLNSGTWGSNSQQALTLIGTLYLAFVGSATTVHLGSSASGKQDASRRGPHQPQRSAGDGRLQPAATPEVDAGHVV